MQTLKHWRCTETGFRIYTVTSSPPPSFTLLPSSVFIHNSHTVVRGYWSPRRPVFEVPIATGWYLLTNEISVSMVTGCTGANLKESVVLVLPVFCIGMNHPHDHHRPPTPEQVPPGCSGDSSKYWCWHFMHFSNGGRNGEREGWEEPVEQPVPGDYPLVKIHSPLEPGLVCIASESLLALWGFWRCVSGFCGSPDTPGVRRCWRCWRRQGEDVGKKDGDKRGPGVSPRHIHAEVLHIGNIPLLAVLYFFPSVTGKVPWQKKKK